MKPIIIYSALHTGTHFICGILKQNSKEKIIHLGDYWSLEKYNKPLEELITKATSNNIETVIKDIKDTDNIILQIHQRKDDLLYRSIYSTKPEVPIVIPIRDPMLSINTRIWRECKKIEKLQNEPKEYRKARIIDQLNSITRLLDIPEDNRIIISIDKERRESDRTNTIQRLVSKCELTLKDKPDIIKFAREWKPINATSGQHFAKVNSHLLEEKEFVEIKNAILTGDMALVKKYMSMELEITRKLLKPFKNKLDKLGYSNIIHWW